LTQKHTEKEEQALFRQISRHLLEDAAPSAYLEEVSAKPEFSRYPFSMLQRLRACGQSPVHHPEGNAWNHTLLVVDEAARRRSESRDAEALMWAALLHDIGKPDTTRFRGRRVTAYNHDTAGEGLSRAFLSALTGNTALIERVAALVRYHMHVLYAVKGLPFADLREMKRRTEAREVALLGLCDRLGRSGARQTHEEEQISLFLALCGKSGKEGNQDGGRGSAQGTELHKAQEQKPQIAHSRSLGAPGARSERLGKKSVPKQPHDQQLKVMTGDALMPKNNQPDPKKGQNQKNYSPKPIPISHDNSDQNRKVKKTVMDSNVQ
jgi:putative nucleotidyltransferase with HDIG domain